MLVYLFFAILGDILKKYIVAGLGVIALVALVVALCGGNFLLGAGLTAGVGLVIAVIVAMSAINGGWH